MYAPAERAGTERNDVSRVWSISGNTPRTEYTECRAFSPVLRSGSSAPSAPSECCPPPPFGSKGQGQTHSLAGEVPRGANPDEGTESETLWYSRFSIIPLRTYPNIPHRFQKSADTHRMLDYSHSPWSLPSIKSMENVMFISWPLVTKYFISFAPQRLLPILSGRGKKGISI